jgi:CRISPR-associated protein Cas2
MFDLPTETRLQRKAAGKFRNYLLDQGFERAQFSVYARFVSGKEGFTSKLKGIERNLPEWGDVQILQFTDKQYENIHHYSDQGRKKARKNPEQLVLF